MVSSLWNRSAERTKAAQTCLKPAADLRRRREIGHPVGAMEGNAASSLRARRRVRARRRGLALAVSAGGNRLRRSARPTRPRRLCSRSRATPTARATGGPARRRAPDIRLRRGARRRSRPPRTAAASATFGQPTIAGIGGWGFEADLRLDPSNANRLYMSAPDSRELRRELHLALARRRQDVQVGARRGAARAARSTTCHGGGDTELAVDPTGRLYFNDLTLANFSVARSDDHGPHVPVQQHRRPGRGRRPPVVRARRRPDGGRLALPRRTTRSATATSQCGNTQPEQHARHVPLTGGRRRRDGGARVRPAEPHHAAGHVRRGDHGQRRGQPGRDEDRRRTARRSPTRRSSTSTSSTTTAASARSGSRAASRSRSARRSRTSATRAASTASTSPSRTSATGRGPHRRQLPDARDRQGRQPLRGLGAGAVRRGGAAGRRHVADVLVLDRRGQPLVDAGPDPDARAREQRLRLGRRRRRRPRRHRVVRHAGARRPRQRRPDGCPNGGPDTADGSWSVYFTQTLNGHSSSRHLQHAGRRGRAPDPARQHPDDHRQPVRRRAEQPVGDEPHARRLLPAPDRQQGRGADLLRRLDQPAQLAARHARDVRAPDRRHRRVRGASRRRATRS